LFKKIHTNSCIVENDAKGCIVENDAKGITISLLFNEGSPNLEKL